MKTVGVVVRPLGDVDSVEGTHNHGLFLGKSGSILGSRPGSESAEGEERSGTFRDRFHIGECGRVKSLMRRIMMAGSPVYITISRG